jgi:hypothetical protein
VSDVPGPEFQLVEEITADRLAQNGGTAALTKPLLVKGAVKAWPAWERWSFEKLSELRRPDGSEVLCRFQSGLVEQGATQPLPVLPVAPYLRELAEASRTHVSPEAGLLSESRRRSLAPGAPFHLEWSYLGTFETNRRYLADWQILLEFPQLRRDFAIRTLWPGRRWSSEYVFIGPAHTLTGLHHDIADNWFCQVRGTKELVLIPPDQSSHMCVSGKYNMGSVLSTIDVSNLARKPREAEEFAKTRGFYARAEAGDALFIPKRTWHAVLALEPSISLGIFGLTPFEVVTTGAWAEFKHLLHRLRLYRRGNCICHASAASGATTS